MSSKNLLSKLTPAELMVLHKHTKLGKSHLQKTLLEHEIKEVFELGIIPTEAENELAITKIEVLGQESLAINAIMTATLGAWMGLSTFLKLRLDSRILFISVLSFALVVGAIIGFQSGMVRKKSSAAALDKRKLQDLEMAILKEMNNKRKEEIKEKISELTSILDYLGIPLKIGSIEKETNIYELCLTWVNYLYQNIKQSYEKTPFNINLISEVEKTRTFLLRKSKEDIKKDSEVEKLKQIVFKLIHTSINPTLTLKPWIQTNFNSLLVGLIPTLFGGFSSLFVYLGGAPTIAKEMGQESLFNFLTQPNTKLIEFILAISVTLYFAFSFLYLNKKAYMRDRELAKIDIYLTKEENFMDTLDDRLLKLKEALSIMQKLQDLFRFSKRFEKEKLPTS